MRVPCSVGSRKSRVSSPDRANPARERPADAATLTVMRRHCHSASPYEKSICFSRAVRTGDRIEVSGTAPIGPDGATVVGGAFEQAQRCFSIIRAALEELGGSMSDVVRTRMYLVDAADWEVVGRAHGEAFVGVDPAATMVVAGGLLDDEWRVEIEASAVVDPS